MTLYKFPHNFLWGADPASDDPADVAAGNAARERSETLFLNPIFRGHAPTGVHELAGDAFPGVRDGEMALIAQQLDYLAARLDLPLIVLTTALSADAFMTRASGIRKDGCVYHLATKPPDAIIIDFEVIARAPAPLRAAGITDVLSIATGSWDWKFARECEKHPPETESIPWAFVCAHGILSGALDCAKAAGRGDPEGLKTWLDCPCTEVQLCNQIGHARLKAGSKHYFAYAVENEMRPGLPHGNLVGPAILLIARLPGQDTARLEKALRACHVPLTSIPQDVIDRTLNTLPEYCARHNLAYGISHTL